MAFKSRSPQDAQHELERSLLNVRELIESMEVDEIAERRRQKRLFIGILALVAILLMSLAIGIAIKNQGITRIEVPAPDKLPPVRAGPSADRPPPPAQSK